MRLRENAVEVTLVTTGKLRPNCIVEGYGGDLWVGTDQGIHRLINNHENIENEGYYNRSMIFFQYSYYKVLLNAKTMFECFFSMV